MKDLEKLLDELNIEKRMRDNLKEERLIFVRQSIDAIMLKKLIRTSKLICVSHYDAGLILHLRK